MVGPKAGSSAGDGYRDGRSRYDTCVHLDMVARGKGAVINVSTRVAFQPSAYFSVYAASKAFRTFFQQ